MNSLIEELSLKLHINHHFTLAYCPWSNGTIEIINRHILYVFRSLISEFRLDLVDWPVLIPFVRFALNHSIPPDRLAAVTLFMGFSPSSPLDSIYNPRTKAVMTNPFTAHQLQQLVADLQKSFLAWHREVEEARNSRRDAANSRRRTATPNFSTGDYVLVSNVLNVRRNKLQVRWSGPYRIISAKSDYIFTVLDLLSEKTFDCHCSRMRFYSDGHLHITEEILKQFAHDGHGFEIADVLNVRFNHRLNDWEVFIAWAGFESAEHTWEPLSQLLKDCPVFIKRRLRNAEFCPPELVSILDN